MVICIMLIRGVGFTHEGLVFCDSLIEEDHKLGRGSSL